MEEEDLRWIDDNCKDEEYEGVSLVDVRENIIMSFWILENKLITAKAVNRLQISMEN